MPPRLWCSTLGPLNRSVVEALVIFGYLDDHRFCDGKSKQSSKWNLSILTSISIKYTEKERGFKCLERIIMTRAGALTVHHHQPRHFTQRWSRLLLLLSKLKSNGNCRRFFACLKFMHSEYLLWWSFLQNTDVILQLCFIMKALMFWGTPAGETVLENLCVFLVKHPA